MRQIRRDRERALEELDPAESSHDLDRAEDIVAELERLGVVTFAGS